PVPDQCAGARHECVAIEPAAPPQTQAPVGTVETDHVTGTQAATRPRGPSRGDDAVRKAKIMHIAGAPGPRVIRRFEEIGAPCTRGRRRDRRTGHASEPYGSRDPGHAHTSCPVAALTGPRTGRPRATCWSPVITTLWWLYRQSLVTLLGAHEAPQTDADEPTRLTPAASGLRVGRRRPAQSWSACRKVRCAPGWRSGTVVSKKAKRRVGVRGAMAMARHPTLRRASARSGAPRPQGGWRGGQNLD